MNSPTAAIPSLSFGAPLRAVLIVVFCNIVIFLPAVFLFPGFIGDDYVVMEYIERRPDQFFAEDTNAPFFLYTRPLSVAFFRLLHFAAPDEPLTMKLITVTVHLLYASIVPLIFFAIGRITGRRLPDSIVILISLIVTLHPDALLWVDWISNANELLMLLLYAGGLFCLLRYASSAASSPLLPAAAVLLFLLSTLAKQQSIHFPLIILLFTHGVWRNVLSPLQRRTLTAAAAVGAAAVAVEIYVNYHVNIASAGIVRWDDLPKKPFAVIGTIFYIGVPLFGLDLYHFFVAHKFAAVVTAIVMIGAAYRWRNNIPWNFAGTAAVVTMFVFFPRFIGPGGERINALQLLWFGILLAVLADLVPRKTLIRTVLCVMLAGNIIATGIVLERQRSDYRTSHQMIAELRGLQQSADRPIVVLFSTLYVSWPQQLIDKGEQSMPDIMFSGVITKPMVRDFGITLSAMPEQRKDTITVTVTDAATTLDMLKYHSVGIKVSGERSAQRGWRRISFVLPDSLRSRPLQLVYPSDTGWVRLSWEHP